MAEQAFIEDNSASKNELKELQCIAEDDKN
jgi:hypothetical protein